MTNPDSNDIRIGEDRWIPFVELNDEFDNAIELDPILSPIAAFLDQLEIHCVAGCCGIDAYGLWPEEIAAAARNTDIKDLARAVDDVLADLNEVPGNAFVSRRMNNYFHRQTLIPLIEHIARHVHETDVVG